jgi:hypothetical protein
MAIDSSSLRRRAAVSALSGLLDDAALMDALLLLHDSLRSDNITDVIRYIDNVARKNGLDAGTAKRLYPAFFGALKKPEDELPLDPLPLMMAARQSLRLPAPAAVPMAATYIPAPRPVPMPVPVPVPVYVAPAVAVLPPEPVVVPMIEPDPPKAPEVEVFAALIHFVVERMAHYHANDWAPLRADALQAMDRSRLPAALRQQLHQAWAAPSDKAWKVEASAKELSEVVHQIYVALCENLGPVDADRIMTGAVQTAERLPQARQFSPKKFL